MRIAPLLRVIAYLILGAALALVMLAVRTYPAEQTWVDRAAAWSWDRTHATDWTPTVYRPRCGWRVIGCRSLPAPLGPLISVYDPMADGTGVLACVRLRAYDGRLAPDALAFFCDRSRADTALGFEIAESGLVLRVWRSWRPSELDQAYDSIVHAYDALHGRSVLCPQSDDLSIKENRRWQLTDRNVGVAKVMDARVQVDVDLGRVYCHAD